METSQPKQRPDYTLLCSSSAQCKLDAGWCGAQTAGLYPVEFTDMTTRSGVNPMPIGVEETVRGAANRLKIARDNAKEPARTIVYAIENGMIPEGDGYVDKAYLLVELPNGTRLEAWSAAVAIPPGVAKMVLEASGQLTVGEAMQRLLHRDCDPQNWHVLYGKKKSRTALIQEAIVPLLREAKRILADLAKANTLDLTNGVEPAHETQAGPYRVRIPHRANKHVRLAFFNLKSARALTINADKRLAKALAEKAPTTATIVVAPDGKGEALARAFADAIGARIIFLSKKDRGELDPVADRQSYKSITTDTIQALHLTEDCVGLMADAHVIVLDDVISTGWSAWACGQLVCRQGARKITYMAVFQEGTREPATLDDADVIVLGALPAPVPVTKGA